MSNRLKIEEGQEFGLLKVIKEVESLSHNNITYRQFELKCECGNIVTKKLRDLRNGDTKTCGCVNLGRATDLTGIRFGKLIALSPTRERNSNNSVIWNCECDCGNSLSIGANRLMHEGKEDCGCTFVPSTSDPSKLVSPRMSKHGMYNTPTYRSWSKLCSRTRNKEYEEWHGDVTVCERWDTFKGGSFENFFADMGERPEGTTINRINGAKIYSKETCEWATLSVQSFDQKRNKHNTSGRTGVRFRADRDVWIAQICKDKEIIQLYYGPSFYEACKAREEAELKYYGFTKE